MAELSPGRRLFDVLKQFAFGSILGDVFPPRDDTPALPDIGAREHALRQLRAFLALTPFMRTMEEGQPPQAFLVPEAFIHINNPGDAQDADHHLPYIAFLPGTADYNADSWLGPALYQEDTEDVFGIGTALYYLGDHVETFQLQVVAEHPAIRRAIIEGTAQLLSTSEDSAALRLSLPNYFGVTASFLLQGEMYDEGEQTVRNRRMAQLMVQLTVPRVMLAAVEDMRVYTEAIVGTDVDITFGVGTVEP